LAGLSVLGETKHPSLPLSSGFFFYKPVVSLLWLYAKHFFLFFVEWWPVYDVRWTFFVLYFSSSRVLGASCPALTPPTGPGQSEVTACFPPPLFDEDTAPQIPLLSLPAIISYSPPPSISTRPFSPAFFSAENWNFFVFSFQWKRMRWSDLLLFRRPSCIHHKWFFFNPTHEKAQPPLYLFFQELRLENRFFFPTSDIIPFFALRFWLPAPPFSSPNLSLLL